MSSGVPSSDSTRTPQDATHVEVSKPQSRPQGELEREVRHVAGEVEGWRRDALLEAAGLLEQLQTVERERDEAVEDALRLGAFSGKDEAVAEVERLKEQLEAAREFAADKQTSLVSQWREEAEAQQKRYLETKEQYQALDRFIRETISVWDVKGPLIASEELRERYANFTSNPARELAPSEPHDNETGGSLVETHDPASESGYERTDIYKDGKFVGRHGRVVSNQDRDPASSRDTSPTNGEE